MAARNSQSSKTRRNQVNKKLRRRHLVQEVLEQRQLMAYAVDAIYAPGTTDAYIKQWEGQLFGPQLPGTGLMSGITSPINLLGFRWDQPTGGPSPNTGDGAVISWSIVPDGTAVAGGATGTSNLIAFMDGIYGSASGPLSNRPWFPIFKRVYDNWGDLTGIDFVYEPNDDGVGMANTAGARGRSGVRGDVRIGGARIDGNSNVLAYNFIPTTGGTLGLDGDMVIDTADNFYLNNSNGPFGENRGLINVLGHEAGHGIGLGHVEPVNGTKLMEPFVNFAFYGPQHDDIRAAQVLYGDRYSNNDSSATAASLGPVSTVPTVIDDLSIEGNDADWFSFTANSGDGIDLIVTPKGFTYDVGIDATPGPNNDPTAPVNSLVFSNLRFELYDPQGNKIADQNANPAGQPESVSQLKLPSTGTYRLFVSGTVVNNEAQLYNISLVRTSISTSNVALQPRLIGVAPNDGILLEMDPGDPRSQLTASPTQLTLSFDGSNFLDINTLGAITVEYSEKGDFSDVVSVPIGYRDLDSKGRVVTVRFAEALKDGRYRVVVTTNLLNTSGQPFLPIDPSATQQTVEFDLELGGHVIAVVPQPIDSSNPSGILRRPADIDVYFDDIELFQTGSTLTTNPSVYQLIDTQSTVQYSDDNVHAPISITPDVVNRKVTLTFANDLHLLGGPSSARSYRLRIGDNLDPRLVNVTSVTPLTDPGLTSATAQDLGSLTGRWSRSVTQTIVNSLTGTQLPLADNPGGNFEPGHRDIDVEEHLEGDAKDTNNGIGTITYTFSKNKVYSTDVFGNPLTTRITPDQEERFREILEIYGALLGVDVQETDGAANLELIVGDLRYADPSRTSGPGGVAGLGGPGLVVMDFADFGTSSDNTFGGNFFGVALHEVGHALGLGHTYDLPAGTIMGDNGQYPASSTWAFPGDNDIVHGERIHQKESLDVDLYRFQVTETGTFTAQTLAERLASASLLDTRLTLFRSDASGGLTLVSANDDYFGTDSYIQYDLTPGNYFLGVSAEGNNAFDPNTGTLAAGGVSAGNYQLRLDFNPTTLTTILDSAGTALDGDRDGAPGGNYNFWFEVTPTAGINPAGPTTLYVHKAAASGGNGSLTQPFNGIDEAFAAAKSGDTVRVVADYGLDNNLNTPADALGFEVGRVASLNKTLDDGRNLEVPAGVNVVIDAGVVMKFLDARMSVGSDDNGVDRSGATLQVLGTPQTPVYFTSYNDRTIGRNFNSVVSTPASGNWGGVELRNDADRAQGRADLERQGIFQNYINHAEMRYGGGTVSTLNRVVDPLHLSSVRADISFNSISDSADAAISADPNTFEITSFVEPRYQRFGTFAVDYDRVGPDIFRNVLQGNSINGLFVRVDTLAGSLTDTLQVAARFNDTDIVHVLGENVQLQGTPGGPFVETVAPSATTVGLQAVTGGSMLAGSYRYRFTMVDAFGNESLASSISPTTVTLAGANNAVSLTGIPAATGAFIARRLYRSSGGSFQLVAELDKSTASYVDRLANPLTPFVTAAGSITRGRPDASLVFDPGMIVKSQSTRIELGLGTTLIAEGTPGRDVIFTSRADDRYGAGGTFDTNQNGPSTGNAGDWSGIFAERTSRISLDNAFVAFAGGVSGVAGTTAGFNAIEIHQANARISNSQFESNANGTGGQSGATREGRGPNEASVIFVEASQPVIVGNQFVNNTGANSAAISINANAMNSFLLRDAGRQTGDLSIYESPPGNTGPVFRGNEMSGNTLNALRVRGETLTTESVWDDTDIVHVLGSNITVPDYHTYGGLRLQSSASESLVVKASNAGFTATGRSLDITDRIGGRIQVLGTPSFPVVVTGLTDCTVGAGFTPDGVPQTDTVNTGVCSALAISSGQWTGFTFDEYSHDRNVSATVEREGAISGFGDLNGDVDSSQQLGGLARDEKSTDENLRLGFTVYGSIADRGDVDVYSFTGTAGTLTWIDIDRTDPGLNTVVELIDGNGKILALSDDSRREATTGALTYVDPSMPSGHALPMKLDPLGQTNADGTYFDLYSLNDGDAGMRVVLPGVSGTTGTFYVRVRSFNPTSLTANANITSGVTTGGYQLQVRLQETDEIGGSTIRHADIRYATSAIRAIGLPAHSPLAAELVYSGSAALPFDLGNFANTDRGAVSVSGNSGGPADFYVFQVGRDGIQVINDPNAAGATNPTDSKVSLTIDLDWSDNAIRPNTNSYLYFRPNGSNNYSLVAIGTDSNIADDRSISGVSSTEDDLSRGSLGPKDAYIGPMEMSSLGTYQLVVTNNGQIPVELRQYFLLNAPNVLARLEPLDINERIADDRFSINTTEEPPGPQGPNPIQVAFEDDGSNIIPWQFGDIPLLAMRETAANNSRLSVYNPFTGQHDAIINVAGSRAGITAPLPANTAGSVPIGSFAGSSNGIVVGIEKPNGTQTDGNTDTFFRIDSDGDFSTPGNTGIGTFEFNPNAAAPGGQRGANDGMQFEALAFYEATGSTTRFLYGVASRPTFTPMNGARDANNNLINAGAGLPQTPSNIIYRIDPDTGAAISRRGTDMPGGFESINPIFAFNTDNNANNNIPNETPWAGTSKVAQVQIPTVSPTTLANTGNVTSLVADFNNATLFAFTDTGAVWQMNISVNGGTNLAAGDINGAPTILIDPTVAPLAMIQDSLGNSLIFDKVTQGPELFSDTNSYTQNFGRLFFGVTTTGNMYAFDLTTRVAQPVFAYGSDRVAMSNAQTGGNYAGLYFSPLDNNLWHLSDTDQDVAGHGFTSLDSGARDATSGGGTLFFGFDALNDDFNHISNASVGNSANLPTGFTGYNFLGGAHGSVQSNELDLSGIAAEDKPTLYFTYRLGTENRNADFDAADATANRMRDSFRVYVAGTDNVWRLVATNNMSAGINGRDWDPTSGAVPEYSPGVSGYTSSANQIFVQELFDDANNYRQARIDLGPWAGQDNVRIRYEFTTAGEARPDQSEIQAADAYRIRDRLSFTLTGNMPDRTSTLMGGVLPNLTKTFEFDTGLVVDMPAGALIPAGGATLTGPTGTVVRLIKTGVPGANEVLVLDTDDASVVATKVQAVIPGVVLSADRPSWVNFTTQTTVGAYNFTLSNGLILGTPGVTTGNVAIPITIDMDQIQVRDAIQTALVNEIHYSNAAPLVSSFPVVGNTSAVRIYNLALTLANNPGNASPLVLIQGEGIAGGTSNLPATQFGVYRSGATRSLDDLVRAGQRSVGTGNGVHVDDIVIGLAERGEHASNSTVSTGPTLADNPVFQPTFAGTGLQEISSGPYQLELRTSLEYADPSTQTRDDLDKLLYLSNNQRLSKSTDLVVTSDGSVILDGDRFTLSNGYDTIVFEFDNISSGSTVTGLTPQGAVLGAIPITFTSSDTPGLIASRIRDAINSPAVNGKLNILATTSGGARTGVTTDPRILLHGRATADTLGGLNFGPHIAGVINGGNLVTGEDLGDANRFRDQGQFIVESSIIRNSSSFGIIADAGSRTPGSKVPNEGDRPKPGSVQAFPTLNSLNQIPGVVIVNNLLFGNQSGILVSGDNTPGAAPLAPETFARLVNNTIFGQGSGVGTGIRVDTLAAPTLLNNVVVNNGTGIQVVSTNAGNTEVRGNVFQNNGNNGTTGSDAIFVPPATRIFENVAAGNFYPASGSPIIDNSVDQQGDRLLLLNLKNDLGIAPSPILSPDRDLVGQVRADDGTANGSTGVGLNPNKDRGALDRVDTLGPLAQLLLPLDNDRGGLDDEPLNTNVFRDLTGKLPLPYFAVQLNETNGIGPNPTTITRESVILTENGRVLTEGSEYTFGYSSSSRQIRFTPVARAWRQDAVYEVTLLNKDYSYSLLPSGDRINDGDQINLAGTATGTFEFDSGFVFGLNDPISFSINAGTGTGGFQLGDRFSITNGPTTQTFEFTDSAGQPAVILAGRRPVVIAAGQNATTVRDAILAALIAAPGLGLNPVTVGATGIQLGATSGQTFSIAGVPITLFGSTQSVADGQTFTYFDKGDYLGTGGVSVTFEINVTDGPNPTFNSLNHQIAILSTDTPDQIAAKIAAQMRAADLRLTTARSIEGGRVYVGGNVGDTLDLGTLSSTLLGTPGVTGSLRLHIPGVGEPGIPLNDPTFSITRNGVTTVFELSRDVTSVGVRVLIQTGDSALIVANKIAAAIRSVSSLGLPNATVDPNDPTQIILNEGFDYSVNPVNSGFTVTGVSGGAIPVPFIPSTIFTAEAVANQIVGAVTATPGLGLESFAVGGGRVYFNGLTSQTGISVTPVLGIRDLAGNLLQANRPSNFTRFTIILGPEKQFDFGDANVRETVRANDGARHVILSGSQFTNIAWLGGAIVDSEADGIRSANADADGADENGLAPPTIFSVFNANFNTLRPAEITVNVYSDLVNDPNNLILASGLIDAWADWNQDGDFSDAGEQVLKNIPVIEGANLLKIVTPSTARIGQTVLRLRVSPTGNLTPDEVVVGGEVEDHVINVIGGRAPITFNDTYTWIENPDPTNLNPAPVTYSSATALVPGTLVGNDTDADLDNITVLQIIDPFTGREYLVRPGVPASITLEDQLNVGGARSVAGVLTVNSDGSFTFQTDPDYNTDNYPSNNANPLGDRRLVFYYHAVDSSGVPSFFNGTSGPATVTLNILPTNDPPVPGADGPIQVLEDFDGETVNDNALVPIRGLYGVQATVSAVLTGTPNINFGPVTVNVTDGILDPELSTFNTSYDIDIDDNRISFNLRAASPALRGVLPVGYSETFTFVFNGLPLTEDITSFTLDVAGSAQPNVTIVNRNTLTVQFADGMTIADGLVAGINVTTTRSAVGTVPLVINGQSVNAIVRSNSAITATSSKLEMLIPASALLANDITGGERNPVQVVQATAANVFTDVTVAATENINSGDVAPFGAIGSYVAVGFSRAFDGLYFDRTGGVVGTGGAIAWEYLNSTGTWSPLTVVDGTAGFSSPLANNQRVSFTPPAGWNAQTVNGNTQFWVRARVTTAFTTAPTFGRVTLSPANFNERVTLNDGIGSPDIDNQTLSLVSVQTFNGQPGYDVALTVNTLTFDFGNGPETAIRIVPEEHAVGFGQFTYVVQDDGGIDRANPPGSPINQTTGTVSLEFKRVNDAPIPDAFQHADRNYTVSEVDDLNPPNPFTNPMLVIPVNQLISFNTVDGFRKDEPGPRRGNVNPIEEFAEQQLRVMRVVPVSQQGGTVIGIDQDNNLANGYEAIGYTPKANFDSFDDDTNLPTVPDIIEYFVSDFSLAGQSPENWIRDAAGNLISSPRSLENELPAAQIQVIVTAVNDPPGVLGNPDSSNSPSFATPVPLPGSNQVVVEALEDTPVTYPNFLGPQGTTTLNNPTGFVGAHSGISEHDPLYLNNPAQAIQTFDGAGFQVTTAQGATVTVSNRSVTADVRDGDYSVTYTPTPASKDFFGNDTVVLRLMDRPLNLAIQPQSTLITITFSVRPVNDNPLGTSDTLHILEDTTGIVAPVLVLQNDFISNGNIQEDQNTFGNVAQSVAQFTLNNQQVAGNFVGLRKVSGFQSVSGLAIDDGDVGFDINGNLTIKPPKGIYTKAKDINGNFVDVREPLVFTYKYFNPGTSYIDHDNNPATPLIVDANDVTRESPEVTVTVHVWPVNDAPVTALHLYQPTEDTQLHIDAMDLVVDAISAPGTPSTPALSQIDEDDDLTPARFHVVWW